MKSVALLLMVAMPLGAGEPVVKPQAIAAHMRFLASDLLEGRETGTRGYDTAAAYVAAQFDSLGLRTSFQPLPFRAATLIEERSSLAIDGEPLVSRKDFVLRPNFLDSTSEVTAPLVFAGFGIVAPELRHDDYAAIDAHGKIVLIVSGAPPAFPTDQRAYYSSQELKQRTAAAHGAVGILTLNSITDEARTPFEKRAQQSGISPMLVLDGGRPADAVEQLRANALVSRAAAEKLFAGAPMTIDTVLADAERSIPHSFPLTTAVAIRTTSQFSEKQSANVIGMLRGSDPKLRDEYVVVSAHLDHLGNHPQPDRSDPIYNGAYDNASGIACLIEIARAFASQPRPRRSILFVAFTGEEKGEQGSKAFVRHPPVPTESIVADVNMDMFLMLYPVRDLVALGGEHTSLGAMFRDAATAAGFEISPDPYPEEVRFIRSDQFSFVKGGIPAIHVKPGNKSSDASIDGAKVTREWLRRAYHSTADDMNQPMDFASGARYAEMNFRLVRAIANAWQRPHWTPGDFFAPK